jgi:transcriptional regulator with XRE-family HTH domain
MPVSHSVCNDILNHTSLCEYQHGKILIHLTIPFERKPKSNLPGDNLRYYRFRKQLTTRQVAEAIGVVPGTITIYESNKNPIPHNMAIKLAGLLEINPEMLFDDFANFIADPYTAALRDNRIGLKLNQREFADYIGIELNYYYKLEEGKRRPSRRIYQKLLQAVKSNERQTSLVDTQALP